jgi:hypothetical protein
LSGFGIDSERTFSKSSRQNTLARNFADRKMRKERFLNEMRVHPTPERPLSPCVINTVSHSPEAIAAAAWRTWIMNEQPLTAVRSTHFGVRPR